MIHILIVEDNKMHADFISSILNSEKFYIQYATDGQVALDLLIADSSTIEIVLVDYQLPNLNGIALIEKVKKTGKLYEFIFVTADKSVDTIIKAMKAGASDFIAKSADLKSDLIPMVEKVYTIYQTKLLNKLNDDKLKILSAGVEQSGSSIVITDLEGKIEYVNSKFTEITGYTYQEALGQNPRILKSGDKPADYYSDLWNILKSGNTWKGEFLNKKKNGETFYEEAVISPIKNSKGEIIKYLAVKDDITIRKQANIEIENKVAELHLTNEQLKRQSEKLQQTTEFLNKANEELTISEEKYRLLAENLTDVIWVLNLTQNKYTYISQSVTQLTGFSVDEAMLQSVEECLEPASFEIVKQRLPAAIQSFLENPCQKNHHYFEMQQLCKDGNYIWIETITQLQLAKNGDIELLGVSRNIEKRKILEAEIQKQIVQLEELNATKDKFFSIISHDLKNPFNTIIGFSGLLVKNLNKYNTEKIANFIGTINSSSKSAYKLLENLLEWSYAQTGKIDFKPENLILENIIIDVFALTENIATAKNISLNYQLSESLLAFADSNMLKTVLRNLITNAIKFTNKNGNILITAIQKDKVIEITVSDTGIGMNEKTMSKLFKINEKVSTLGTEAEKGSGLGLLLCKEFIEKHGGKIWVESVENSGSNFKFTIPLSDSQ